MLHWTLSYIIVAVTICISISVFASSVDISKGFMSSTIGLNIWAVIARIKNYKSIIEKRKHDEISSIEKTNLSFWFNRRVKKIWLSERRNQ